MLLGNFRYCSGDVKCMLFRSYCTNMYCCPLWFNSISSSIKKLKASYNGVLRRLLLIVKSYSASEMFVTHGIPSFFNYFGNVLYILKERIDHSSNKIGLLISDSLYPLSNPTMMEISIVLIVILFFSTIFIYIRIFNIFILYMDVCLK